MWSLLSVVAEEERRDLRRCLHRTLEVWSKQGKLTQPLVRTVCSHTANKQHEKVSRAFLRGYLELYMYMYLPSPLYNMQYVHICTMHVHTYYMYIHIQYVSTVHVLHMYRLYGCAGIFMALYTIFFAWWDFPNTNHVYRMYTNPCTQVMVCRID